MLAAGCQSAPPKVLVTYSRTGGFAAMQDELTVRSDGDLALSQRGGVKKRGGAASDEIGRLRDLIGRREFAALPENIRSDGADQFVHAIKTADKSVTTNDGADQPQVLRDTLELLQTLMSRCK